MASPLVVSVLTKKYAKLLGEHEFAERMTEDAVGLDAIIEATHRCDKRKKEIEEKLEAIETVIWMYEPDWNPASVHPTRPSNRYHKQGSIARAAYAVLRDAIHPLTTRQISKMVIQRIGMKDPEERDVARIDVAIHNTLSNREGRTIKITAYNPIRWAVIPRELALARTKRSLGTDKPPLRAVGRRAS